MRDPGAFLWRCLMTVVRSILKPLVVNLRRLIFPWCFQPHSRLCAPFPDPRQVCRPAASLALLPTLLRRGHSTEQSALTFPYPIKQGFFMGSLSVSLSLSFSTPGLSGCAPASSRGTKLHNVPALGRHGQLECWGCRTRTLSVQS